MKDQHFIYKFYQISNSFLGLINSSVQIINRHIKIMEADDKAMKKHSQIQKKSQTTLSQLRRTQSIFLEEKTNFIFQKIHLTSEILKDQLSIYDWRNSTQKDIVKCTWTCIFPLQKNELVVETKRKYFPFNLGSFSKMSLSQLIYILREALNGFQIIYNKFGGFEVSEEMIVFTEDFQLQVWGSKKLSSNQILLNDMNEHQFLCSILRLLQNHQIKTNLTGKFYQGLLRFDFLDFRIIKNYIQNFTRINKLIIPSHNFIKQTFFFEVRKKKSSLNKQKSPDRKYHHKHHLSAKKYNLHSYSSTKDINLIFSPSKKIQRKRLNGLKLSSQNFLKDSDITTQQGDQQNKNIVKKLTKNLQLQKPRRNQSQQTYEFKYKDFIGQKNNIPLNVKSKEQIQVKTIEPEQSFQFDQLKRKSLMQIFQSTKKLEESQSNIHMITFKNEKYESSCEQRYVNSQDQNGFLKFRKGKADFSFFNCIDDLADSKQMNSSIKIGPQIRRQSSVNLEKLGKFKLKMHQSIITEENFFPLEQ